MGCITNIMYWHYGLKQTQHIRERNYNQPDFMYHYIINVLHHKMFKYKYRYVSNWGKLSVTYSQTLTES